MKLLIALSALCLSAIPAGAVPCQLPARYYNVQQVDFGSLRITLATDRSTYAPGDSMHCYLSVHNQGSTARSFTSGASPMDAVMLMDAGCDSIEETDCLDDSPFAFPELLTFFGATLTIQPDECVSFQHSWTGLDAISGLPATPGAYALFGGLTRFDGDSQALEFTCPPGGVRLPLTIAPVSAVPTAPVSWGRLKAIYR